MTLSASWRLGKRILLKSLGVGVGIGLGIAIADGSYAWYTSRPLPQKPWDANAITATFDSADIAKDNRLRIVYILENHTEWDYRVRSSELLLSAVIQEKNSLSGAGHLKFQDDDLFLPTKQHAIVVIELPDYRFPGEKKPSDTPDERKKYREAVRKYVNDDMPRLNEFAAFDDANRYRINFPSGWKSQ
jgi:hypothetical protein